MQIDMIAGFFTAWPVNFWLIRAGIKEAINSGVRVMATAL
jgi:hypothetical protein